MKNKDEGFYLATPDDEEGIALQGVRVDVRIEGVLAHTTIEQKFRNDSKEAIEVLYAFPLPLGATLLGLSIEIAGKKLTGMVQAKRAAETTYEEAVVQGNGAFLLRELDAGRYQMAIGNLKPDESCTISVRYGEFLQSTGEAIRFRLPTVLAPRYGDPSSVGITPVDVPPISLTVNYPLAVRVVLAGNHGKAAVNCPTHAIRTQVEAAETVITLGQRASLDRDFVLLLNSTVSNALDVWSTPDRKGLAVMAALHLPTIKTRSDRPMALTVLVDCSGSMSGDSIAQVRLALLSIVDRMDYRDSLSIIRFGSQTESYAKTAVRVTGDQQARLRTWIAKIEADLGGTEILQGIETALKVTPKGGDVLLITDGEAEISDDQLTRYARKGHRFFTVGVGAAVAEKIVRTLAEESGGACELITPNENMADSIVTHFLRMTSDPIVISPDWGAEHCEAPIKPAIFRGESSVLMARLVTADAKALTIDVVSDHKEESYRSSYQASQGALAEALPRMLASRLIKRLEKQEAEAMALEYQLLTPQTAMVAVLERAADEQTDGLPALVSVPQMLAAGWGGTGGVALKVNACVTSAPDYDQYETPSFLRPNPTRTSSRVDALVSSGIDKYDIPAFLRRQVDSDSPRPQPHRTRIESPRLFAQRLQRDFKDKGTFLATDWAKFVSQYRPYLPVGLIAALNAVTGSGQDRLIAFIGRLIDALDAQDKRTLRSLHRLVSELRSEIVVPTEIDAAMVNQLLTVTSEQWGDYAKEEALLP